MDTKVCTHCNKELPIDDYYLIKKTGYRYGYCKKCHYKKTKPIAKKWRKDNRKRWNKDVIKATKAMWSRDRKGVYLLVTTKGLYIGATNKLKARIQQHSSKTKGNVGYYGAKVLFSFVLAYEDNKRKRLDLERKYIEKYQPKLNQMYTKGFEFFGRKGNPNYKTNE